MEWMYWVGGAVVGLEAIALMLLFNRGRNLQEALVAHARATDQADDRLELKIRALANEVGDAFDALGLARKYSAPRDGGYTWAKREPSIVAELAREAKAGAK